MIVRNQSIDILRGVSIFIIIWAHVSLGWMLDEVVNVTVLGIFFCISGYFYKQQSLTDTIKKKTNSLLKPWLIFSAIGYVYHMLVSLVVDHSSFRWDMIYVDLIKGCDYEANIPCWFFIAMFEILIIYSLLQRFSIKIRNIIAIVSFFLGAVLLANNINYLYIGKTALYLPFVHTGFLIKTMSEKITKHRQSTVSYALMCLVVLAIIYVKVAYISSFYFDCILGYLVCIAVFMLMLRADQDISKSTNMAVRFVAYVGKNSLIVFALHILTNDIVWRLLYPYFHTPDLIESLLYAVISLMLCLTAIPLYSMIFARRKTSPSLKP